MQADPSLPPGQRALPEFPRFGIVAFAKRPLKHRNIRLEVTGPFERPIVLTSTELATLSRVTHTADFHCAAGWSHRAPKWSGFRFRDVWERLILPNANPGSEMRFVVLRCQDSYRTSLPLSDLLAGYRPLMPRLLDHPRARVALEERGQFLPGWILRYAFRPFIKPLIRKIRRVAPKDT